MRALARLFILLGIILYALGTYHIILRNKPNRVSFYNYSTQKAYARQEQEVKPIRVIIKDVGIDLPLIPSAINNNEWELTDQGASFLVSSPIPGEQGNSIIYGHNWDNLLGNLIFVGTGSEVEIEYDDKSKKKFLVRYTAVVEPTESTILAPSDDTRITIYTCTGFLDSKRFVAVATLVD